MITNRKREAARRNGALSRGPVTDSGKRRSSQNARTHGFYASANPVTPQASLAGLVVLTHESPQAFEDFRASFHTRFRPADPVEAAQVDAMVNALWHIQRLHLIETTLLEHEATRLQPELKQTYVDPSSALELSLSYKSLDHQSTERSLQMHIARLNRQYISARHELQILQADRREQDELAAELSEEPEPFPQESSTPAEPAATPESPISRIEPTAEQPTSNQPLTDTQNAENPDQPPSVS